MSIESLIVALSVAVFLQMCLSIVEYTHRNMLAVLEKKVYVKLWNLSGDGRQLIMDLNDYNDHLFHLTYRIKYPHPTLEPPLAPDELIPPPRPLFGKCIVEVNELRRAYNWTKQKAQDFIILFREAKDLYKKFIDCVENRKRNLSCDDIKVTSAEVYKIFTPKNWKPPKAWYI